MVNAISDWHVWAWSGGVVVGAILIAAVGHRTVFSFLNQLARCEGGLLVNSLVHHAKAPLRWILPFLALLVALPVARLSSKTNICGITVFACDRIWLLAFQVFRHPANISREVEVNYESFWQSRRLYKLAVLDQWDKGPNSRRCSRSKNHEGRQLD